MNRTQRAGLLEEYAVATEEREALRRDKERLQTLYQDTCFAADVLGRVESVLSGEPSVLTMESLMPVGTGSSLEPFVRVDTRFPDVGAHERLEVLRGLLAKNTTDIGTAEKRIAVLERLLGLEGSH